MMQVIANDINRLRASNQTRMYVILRSAATKNLRCFASTSFRLSMTILRFGWVLSPSNPLCVSVANKEKAMLDYSGKGKLFLVGLGPGDSSLRTPLALAALQDCDVVVGYRGYIEQIGDLLWGKELVSMELGQELERAARAVELAYAGHTVAVVSSGDAGIYGMAGPVFQVLTDQGWDGMMPQLEVVPGISAVQSAAALLGSPLMQDFCAISLSDLLTPWEVIRRRLAAAAQGDFVVALYNPRSQRRTWQLLEARSILLEQRSPQTPVGIVREAYRTEQRVIITDLGTLEEQSKNVDMFTTVVVGNSTTYVHNGYMVTPRGYEEKQARSSRPPKGIPLET
jgi:precorrin-3B C17-methyltransferase